MAELTVADKMSVVYIFLYWQSVVCNKTLKSQVYKWSHLTAHRDLGTMNVATLTFSLTYEESVSIILLYGRNRSEIIDYSYNDYIEMESKNY
ncbi:Hypothetical predicted protein [Octopus vulgaris]|uniref:Uncharacterized protein n=1 Tax=Octopus vulgaris TaxID=6645 RepID=A0AA36F0K9_OCTVU|nr:Hypothetical predicted protein [Octopus vulgaris]